MIIDISINTTIFFHLTFYIFTFFLFTYQTLFSVFFCTMVKRARNRRSRRGARPRLTRTMNGAFLRGSPDPPAYSNVPWWPVTIPLRYDTGSQSSVGYLDIIAKFRKLFGFPTLAAGAKYEPPVSLRVISIRMWGLEKQPITLAIESIITKDEVKFLTDYGSAINFSHVGWKLSSLASQTPVQEGGDKQKLMWFTSTGKTLFLIRALVRFDSISTDMFQYITQSVAPHSDEPWLSVPMSAMSV